MANSIFRFKEFTINQDKCAMKVGTDGVILGAWTSVPAAGKVLDIGAGTGLLALMIAQRSEQVHIEAIEIDEEAALQAGENVSDSKFRDRISIIHADFIDFYNSSETHYDLIVCNPPYFVKSKKPDEARRALARHADLFTVTELFKGVTGLLKKDGMFSMVLPADNLDEVIRIARVSGLKPVRRLNILPLPGREVKRICLEFAAKSVEPALESLIIEKGERHQYSADYVNLTKDFYLAF